MCTKIWSYHTSLTVSALASCGSTNWVIHKVSILNFKLLTGEAPLYLLEWLQPSNQSWSLKVNDKTCSKGWYMDRSFRMWAPTLRNKLPQHLWLRNSFNQYLSVMISVRFISLKLLMIWTESMCYYVIGYIFCFYIFVNASLFSFNMF